MNILISTTTNWNPGDDFIRFGVKNLLKKAYGECSYVHYDRNPDFFSPDKWEMGIGHKSNVMNNPVDLSNIDLVVLAGSPEFLHGPLSPLYSALRNSPNTPLLVLGVGYSLLVDDLQLSEDEMKVLKRSNTTIVTRQYDLASKLLSLIGNSVYCLPCPAMFALESGLRTNGTLVIPQAITGPQSVSSEDAELTKQYLVNDVLTHYVEDFKQFGGYFSSDAHDLLQKIGTYRKVISNRLHGGIVALGNGAQVKIINTSNRVVKALEPFSFLRDKDGWYMMNSETREYVESLYLGIIKGEDVCEIPSSKRGSL